MEKLGQWLGESPHVSAINKMVDRRECSYKVGESEVTSTGMTALHYAAFYGKMEIVQMLLDCGAGKCRPGLMECKLSWHDWCF